jgi:hypothetical protein
VASLRAFLERSGAFRAAMLLDRGELDPLVLDVAADGSAELAEGDRAVALAPGASVGGVALELPDVRSFPAMEVEAEAGQVIGPPGALEHLARAVRDLVAQLPGRSVLTVGFETADPDLPMFIAARAGEPVVLSLGERQFELPSG